MNRHVLDVYFGKARYQLGRVWNDVWFEKIIV